MCTVDILNGSTIFQPLTQEEVSCNVRVKINPRTGEVIEALWASRPIFRCVAADARDGYREPSKIGTAQKEVWEAEEATEAWLARVEAREAANRLRGARRAQRRLYEFAACNEFDTFITLTLDPEKIDRYDYTAAVRRLSTWLDNRQRRKGLRYIVVPERHRDGAIHFHGLINSEAVVLVPSGHRDKAGREIFNVKDWTLGFTTAVRLDGVYDAVCHYVAKYVVKQVQEGEGPLAGRYFYRSRGLAEPRLLFCSAKTKPAGRDVELPEADLTLTYCQLEQLFAQLKEEEACKQTT